MATCRVILSPIDFADLAGKTIYTEFGQIGEHNDREMLIREAQNVSSETDPRAAVRDCIESEKFSHIPAKPIISDLAVIQLPGCECLFEGRSFHELLNV